MRNHIVFIILVAAIYSWLSCYANAIPSSYYIDNVPYFRQKTKYNCGDASLEMVFGYWGRTIDQKDIDDVARTSKKEGTSSYDIVRTAQFSILSQSQGNVKKRHETAHGFPGYDYGLMAVGYSSNEEWIDALKTAVAQNIPIICLMHYALNDPGGHFRVVVGYDDNKEIFTTHDPWDRDGQPRIFEISYANFTTLWNYTENDSPRGTPFFGVAIWPLQMDISVNSQGNQTVFSTQVSYSTPIPVLSESNLLPKVLGTFSNLVAPENSVYVSQSSYTTDAINEGQTIETQFIIECANTCVGQSFNFTTEIVIQANVPDTFDKHHTYYPPYSYIDVIGDTITSTI